jgi:hypothetical protein
METIPGAKTGEKKIAVVLTHDWGICISFAWCVILMRAITRRVIVAHDRPHEDIVEDPIGV